MRSKTYKVVITTTKQFNAIYYPKTISETAHLISKLRKQYGYKKDGTIIRIHEGYFSIDEL